MSRLAHSWGLLVLSSFSLFAEEPRIVGSEPYELPSWEAAVEATEVENYADREEYERAAGDGRYELRRLRYASEGLIVVAYTYAPRGAATPRPTIVFNRGSWVRGDIAPELLPMFHRLAEEGFAVIAPLYRGSDGAAGKDELGGADLADLINVAPLIREIPWVRGDALFLYGESRGGMMVFQAIRDDFPAVAAATFGGFTDLGAMLEEPRWAAAGRAIWSDLDERRSEIIERRSALAWPEAIDIPVLLMHGSSDRSVSPVQTLDLARRLTALGRAYGLVVFEGDDHVLTQNRAERDRLATKFFRKALHADGGDVETLAPGVHLLRGAFVEGRQPDGNSVVFEAPQGLIVVDTGRHGEHTEALLRFAKKRDLPVAAIVNTHWHLDHISGNALVRRAYPEARIHASGALEGALKGFLAGYRSYLADAIPKAGDKPEEQARLRDELARIDSGPELAPTDLVTESATRTIAGRTLELHLEPRAVTEADVWIRDAKSGVVVAGDLVTLPAPFLDTACPSGWERSLRRLADAEFEILVPGHGAPMTKAQFETYREAFSRLLACAAGDETTEACGARWIAGNSERIPESERAFAGRLMDYYVGSVLRGDPKRLEALCN